MSTMNWTMVQISHGANNYMWIILILFLIILFHESWLRQTWRRNLWIFAEILCHAFLKKKRLAALTYPLTQVDVPKLGSATISRQWAIADIEYIFELPDRPKESTIGPNFLFRVKTTKVSGNTPIWLKFIKTVLPCSSTPKLESSMLDWVNMRRSPQTLTGGTIFLAVTESKRYAWAQKFMLAEVGTLEKIKARTTHFHHILIQHLCVLEIERRFEVFEELVADGAAPYGA